MLHAAAMLSGIFVIWLLYTQLLSTPADFGVAAAAALVCVLAAVRLGGLKRNVFARAPRVFALWLSRWSANVRGVFATLRAAAAADVSLKPALVRLKLQTQNADARAAFAQALSAAPGIVVVDSDADGLLAHVIDEDAVDAVELGEIEARAAAMFGERGRR